MHPFPKHFGNSVSSWLRQQLIQFIVSAETTLFCEKWGLRLSCDDPRRAEKLIYFSPRKVVFAILYFFSNLLSNKSKLFTNEPTGVVEARANFCFSVLGRTRWARQWVRLFKKLGQHWERTLFGLIVFWKLKIFQLTDDSFELLRDYDLWHLKNIAILWRWWERLSNCQTEA